MSYVMACRRHAVHNDDCMACQAFDRAVKAHLSTYELPLQAHPLVVNIHVKEWMGRVFPVPSGE